jgi:hypothetical protein
MLTLLPHLLSPTLLRHRLVRADSGTTPQFQPHLGSLVPLYLQPIHLLARVPEALSTQHSLVLDERTPTLSLNKVLVVFVVALVTLGRLERHPLTAMV